MECTSKYKEQWDKHDYVVIEAQMRPIDAYEFGYEDSANDAAEYFTEVLIQSGMNFERVKEVIQEFKNKFKVEEIYA